MKKCIICGLEQEKFSVEHVIPDSLGGTIKCFQVCKDCNNLLGKNIDAPFINNFAQYLFRLKHNIKGKRGAIPDVKIEFEFNNKKYIYNLANNSTTLIPHLINRDEKNFNMLFDEKDNINQEKAIAGFKNKASQNKQDIDIKIYKEVEEVLVDIKEESTIFLSKIYLEFLKVAHESFFLFVDSYKNSKTFIKNQKFLFSSFTQNIDNDFFEKYYTIIFKYTNLPLKYTDLVSLRSSYFNIFKTYIELINILKEVHIIDIDFTDIHLKIGAFSLSFINFFPEGKSKITILQVPNEKELIIKYPKIPLNLLIRKK